MNIQKLAIIGAGAWGTALAQVTAQAGRDVTLWAYEADVVEGINAKRENAAFLPGVKLHEKIRATRDLAAAASGADAVLVVTPAQHMRRVLGDLGPHLKKDVPVVLCSKGIEVSTGSLMTDIAAEILPNTPLAVLSGPNFAKEIARGLPAATTVACRDPNVAQALGQALSGKTLRPYAADDPVGAEVAGAVKNVIAIACGVIEGRKLGDSARAAVMTRGLAEITRLAVALGGKRETLLGLAGVGDLTMTCSSMTSRNFSLGHLLGEGKSLEEILAGRTAVTEGVATAAAVTALAQRKGVDMPICAAMDAILNQGAPVEETLLGLMLRPLTSE